MLAFVAVGSVFLETRSGASSSRPKPGVTAVLFVANAALFILTGGYFDAPTEADPLLHT